MCHKCFSIVLTPEEVKRILDHDYMIRSTDVKVVEKRRAKIKEIQRILEFREAKEA